jgi:hypothetical protein
MSKKKSKAKAKAKEAKPEGSKIIEQAVVYVQQLAAYDAGFMVDRTGEADFCGTGDHIGKARRAMIKLIGLSPTPLNPIELFAKTKVLEALYGLRTHEEPDETERAYIRSFAGEVMDFLVAHHQVEEPGEGTLSK